MHTANPSSQYIRVNLTIPKEVVEDVKKQRGNISQFASEAMREKLMREKREQAFKDILAGEPSFTEIDDSVAYVRKQRAGDEKRMQRLGI
jgi:hypothetical protein